MRKYHIVLVPDAKVAAVAEDFALTHFASDNEGLCIGHHGQLPHVTITQTEASDENADVGALYAAFLKLHWDEAVALEFGDYYHDVEKPYCGVRIINRPDLQKLHDQSVELFRHLGYRVKGKVNEDYDPHLTFAKTNLRINDPINLPDALIGKSTGWRLEFGYCGDHGAYQGRYEPA